MKDVWVFVEHENGAPARVTLELLGEARRIARGSGGEVGALLLGERPDAVAAPLAHHGADVVYLASHARLRRYDPEIFAATIGPLCAAAAPLLVLFPATANGSDLAARLAAERGWPLACGCVSFRVRDGDVEMVRSIPGAKLHATVAAAGAAPRLATVPAEVIGVDRPDRGRAARSVALEAALPERRRIEVGAFFAADPRTVGLEEAEIVVAAGRGMGSKQAMSLVENLADALGGSVGATRAVVDLGWLPAERQIGQTGKTVRPRLYVACGISGATQHTVGMKEAATIVAINKDPGAPIFAIADLGLRGDVAELLPALTERLRAMRSAT